MSSSAAKNSRMTNSNGTVSYWVTAPGTYAINATKEGYEEGEIVIECNRKCTTVYLLESHSRAGFG